MLRVIIGHGVRLMTKFTLHCPCRKLCNGLEGSPLTDTGNVQCLRHSTKYGSEIYKDTCKGHV